MNDFDIERDALALAVAVANHDRAALDAIFGTYDDGNNTGRLVVILAEMLVLALHDPGDTRADVAASLRSTLRDLIAAEARQ